MMGNCPLLLCMAIVLGLSCVFAQGPQEQHNNTTIITAPDKIPEKCELLTDVQICADMPWNYTIFPNFRGHMSQTAANQEIEQFRQLIEINCSGAIVVFLCAIYTPFCTYDHPIQVLRPCKRLCIHVRERCEPVFNQRAAGLPWPDHLNCDHYEDNDLCFGPGVEELETLTIPTDLVTPGDPSVTTAPTTGTPGPSGEGCSHVYTEHLNYFPECNPYSNGIMRLECAVEVPINAADITIGWFLNCQQLRNDSCVVKIQSHVQVVMDVRRIRSVLTINDLTDDFAGEYTCNMLGDVEYLPSNTFTLRDYNFLDRALELQPCPGRTVFTQPLFDKCALITEDDHPNPKCSFVISQITPTTSVVRSLHTSSITAAFSSSSISLTPTSSPDEITAKDPTCAWLYVVVTVVPVLVVIIVIQALAIICMMVGRWQNKRTEYVQAIPTVTSTDEAEKPLSSLGTTAV